MVLQKKELEPVASEGARRATSDATGNAADRPRRFTAKRKTEVVLRLLRGEDMELLCREYGVTAAKLSEWREKFLEGGNSALKKRNPKEAAEISMLKEKLGESTMEIELLRKKIERLEAGLPLARRRSRR